MNNNVLKLKSIILIILIVGLLQVNAKAYGEPYVSNSITIDGYFDDWKDKPHTDVKQGRVQKLPIRYLFLEMKRMFIFMFRCQKIIINNLMGTITILYMMVKKQVLLLYMIKEM